MNTLEFQSIIKSTLGITNFDMDDSIFENKYGITETDMLFLIYQLINEDKLKKKSLSVLLEYNDITFKSIYNLCL